MGHQGSLVSSYPSSNYEKSRYIVELVRRASFKKYSQGVGGGQANNDWEVIILGCVYALPANMDLIRAEGLKHIPIF